MLIMKKSSSLAISAIVAAFTMFLVAPARSQLCLPTQLNNHTGAGTVACPCFVPNEQAGAVFTAPPQDYPIEILKIGIGWGSQFGGSPQSLELGIHLYPLGLPNPGAPQFTIPGPLLTDGVINVFDISLSVGNKIINNGAFTVALEFLNQNAGNALAPSVVHDGNGCTPAQNVVLAMPGGWNDACLLGVTGDWVMFVEYKCLGPVPTEDSTWGAVKVLYANGR